MGPRGGKGETTTNPGGLNKQHPRQKQPTTRNKKRAPQTSEFSIKMHTRREPQITKAKTNNNRPKKVGTTNVAGFTQNAYPEAKTNNNRPQKTGTTNVIGFTQNAYTEAKTNNTR